MFTRTRSSLYLFTGFYLAAASLTGHAKAAGPVGVVETVQTGDLDLATPSGAATLHRRVALAARDVCAWVDASRRMEYDPFADCVTAAMRQATPQTMAVLAKAHDRQVMVTRMASAH
jgi:UrcA family protein